MAELTYTLGEHPQIIELLSVLEKNNLQRQKEECRPWWGISTAWRISWPR